MEGEIHEGPGLKYLTVTPDDYDPEASYPMVICFTGSARICTTWPGWLR